MASRDLQPGSNQVRILSGAAPRPHPGYSAAERFDYLYDERQLQAWVGPLRELAMQSEKAYAMFNNNNQTNGIAQAPASAELLRRLLEQNGVPAGQPCGRRWLRWARARSLVPMAHVLDGSGGGTLSR
jgi:uncharacterized protein YecE (DUF72 family)